MLCYKLDCFLRPKIFIACFFYLLLLLFSGGRVQAEEMTTVDITQEWGVEVVHLRMTADNYMIELRYKVLDKEKARVLSSRKTVPVLAVKKSRAKLSVPYFPTVGMIKSNRRFLKEGKNYTIMFSNEGKHVMLGDQVRIQAGGGYSPYLTVQ